MQRFKISLSKFSNFSGLPLVASAGCLLLIGCPDPPLKPLTPCTVSGVTVSVEQNPTTKVDVLFVVDNSFTMRHEQELMAAEFPRLVQALADGDIDGDSVQDFTPVEDLHVGVVSTDMGYGFDTTLPSQCAGTVGDDGILRGSGDPGASVTDSDGNPVDCSAVTLDPPFLSYAAGGDVEDMKTRFSCVAQQGTEGCGSEQQLEASLKALTSAESTIEFTNGQGQSGSGRPNEGFLRDNSLVAIILITDSDDCSAKDSAIFDPSSTKFSTPENKVYEFVDNLRCSSEPTLGWGQNALHGVERYVDGLLALRPERNDLVVFGAIVGVPPDLVDDVDPGEPQDYTEILNNSRMKEVPGLEIGMGNIVPLEDINPPNTDYDNHVLVPACYGSNPSGASPAEPARRIVQFAQALDEKVGASASVVQSICEDDFSGALEAILIKIKDKLSNVCLPNDLDRSGDGLVTCDVVELLAPAGTPDTETTCAELADKGREFLRAEGGRELCRVKQLSVDPVAPATPSEPGWFYDDFSEATLNVCGEGGQRIGFVGGAEPSAGALIDLECFTPVKSSDAEIGGACDAEGMCPEPLICFEGTCQFGCETNADCPGANYTCVQESKICVNPLCGGG